MTAFIINSNLAFENYEELIDSINAWLDRDDLDNACPQFIALAEDKIRKRIEPYFLEVSTTLVTDEQGYSALPTDFKQIKRVLEDGEPIYQRGITAIGDMTEDTTCVAAYTIEREGLRVWPAAVQTLQVLYQPLLPRLSAGNPTNRLLDLFPSVYFYGSMMFALAYLEDDDRAASFRALFEESIEEVAKYYREQRQAGPMVARASFVP